MIYKNKFLKAFVTKKVHLRPTDHSLLTYELVMGRLPESYRVSTYRQDIYIELPHRVISSALKMDCRQTF